MNDNEQDKPPSDPVFRPKHWPLIIILGLGAWLLLSFAVGLLLGLFGWVYALFG